MDPRILALVGIRAAALALAIAGQTRASQALYTAADAYESGVNVDAHMKTIADKLKDRAVNDADWDQVEANIRTDLDRLRNA